MWPHLADHCCLAQPSDKGSLLLRRVEAWVPLDHLDGCHHQTQNPTQNPFCSQGHRISFQGRRSFIPFCTRKVSCHGREQRVRVYGGRFMLSYCDKFDKFSPIVERFLIMGGRTTRRSCRLVVGGGEGQCTLSGEGAPPPNTKARGSLIPSKDILSLFEKKEGHLLTRGRTGYCQAFRLGGVPNLPPGGGGSKP